MGISGIDLQVRGTLQAGQVQFAGSGQTLPVLEAPATAARPWLHFAVEGFEPGASVVLRWRGEGGPP